jgi:hypothetical protein
MASCLPSSQNDHHSLKMCVFAVLCLSQWGIDSLKDLCLSGKLVGGRAATGVDVARFLMRQEVKSSVQHLRIRCVRAVASPRPRLYKPDFKILQGRTLGRNRYLLDDRSIFIVHHLCGIVRALFWPLRRVLYTSEHRVLKLTPNFSPLRVKSCQWFAKLQQSRHGVLQWS